MDGVAGNVAGGAANKAIAGDGSNASRRNVGRYAGAATSGAVAGAQAGAAAGGIGALPGAAIGAGKNVAIEAGSDAIKGVSKVTGGSPDAKPVDERQLGAGGTGYERTSKDNSEGIGTKVAKGVAVGGAAAAAPPAMGVVMAMAFLNWLKSMFFAAMAAAMNLGQLIWQFTMGVLKTVGGAIMSPFMSVGSAVAKGIGATFGITVAATVAPVTAVASAVGASIAALALIGTLFTGLMNATTLQDGGIGNSSTACVVNTGSGGGTVVPATSEANARSIYSVLKTWGMPDENIAGILGNWSQESGIDPTSVQTYPTGSYTMTPEKQSAAQNTDNGIGLGQWTFGRNTLLREYAEGIGRDWWTLEVQLAFMATGDNAGDVQVFKDMISTSLGSPSAAALHFHHEWERSADGAAGLAEREADAEMWFGKMSGWTVDSSIVGGVKDIVGGALDGIAPGVSNVLKKCDSKSTGVTLTEGGMSLEQAQALVDLFNAEGDKFLDGRYGENGGPGSCGSNHAMNCVSFSTYFVNKYTTYQHYPWGNGIDTAYTIASDTGKQMSSTPTPYSVGSGPGSGAAGHTLVVLGVQGDQVIIGEAGYCAFMGRVRTVSAAELAADGWMFVDMQDAMLPADQIKTA